METLWPRIERLLPTVSKPARYIGGEQGAVYPEHGPGKVAWLLIYPDTYEIGLPNQGLQILYEILNERPDAAGRADLRALGRHGGGHAGRRGPAVLGREAPPGRRLRRAGLQPVGRARLHQRLNLIDLAGVPLHAADRGGDDPLVVAGGHCAFNPEPLADFVDAFVLGDGEEVVGEVNEVVAAWMAGTPPEERDRAALLRSLARSRASTCRRSTRRPTRAGAWRRRRRRRQGCRPRSRSGPSATWPSGPTRRSSSSRSPRWSTTASTSRCSAAARGAAASARRG